MMNTRFLLSFLLLGSVLHGYAKSELRSPNGRIVVRVDNHDGKPMLETSYRTKQATVPVSVVSVGLALDQRAAQPTLRLLSASPVTRHRDDYVMMTGKRSHCINVANTQVMRFADASGKTQELELRVYNDGVAFRYSAPERHAIAREMTSYRIPEGVRRWAHPLDPDGYEDFYYDLKDGKARPNAKREPGKWSYPLLTEPAEGVFALVTEANIAKGNCGSHLENLANSEQYTVTPASPMTIDKELSTPWRVMIIGRASDLVESTLVTDVSDECRLAHTDWIKPGLLSWVYWAHNHGSKDYQVVRQYIDLAADMHWPYVLIDWEWESMTNGGTIEDAIAYAKGKGVQVVVWYNSLLSWGGDTEFAKAHNLRNPEAREREMAWLQKAGISGIKVDFFYGDSKETMQYYIDLLECAARHRLMVNFHGATVPRGWQRTYPNLMSVEAVYGAEYYNNGPTMTDMAAWHNTVLPFTRNVVGPMDYTPGTFSDSQHPHITTYAHELATILVFESGWQHMPDRPSAYHSLPRAVKALLSSLPTTWDETRLLEGFPGTSVVIARRKGDKWYVAGLNGTNQATTFQLDTSALGKRMSLYTDGADDRSFAITENAKTSKSTHVTCRPRGGFVICFE